MLARGQRLKRSEFTRSFSLGTRAHGKVVTLVYSPAPKFQASVVVPKKVHKRAVDRNRLRRRLYGILYARRHTLLASVIVLVKPPAATLPYEAVRGELTLLLSRVGEVPRAR